jgi:hypothetical protein
MDLAHFLNQRLKFVEYYYASTTALFGEVKSKIEAGEPPYIDNRNPEYEDEPAFLEDWEKADAGITISGAACLDVLQSTFHEFLDEYMNQIGSASIIPHLKEMGKQGWFPNYREFFEKHLQIDWAASGADLELLEQVNLARNDFTHNIDLFSLASYQTRFHSDKYPDSAFADQTWKGLLVPRARQRILPLVVPRETLERVIGTIRTLCEYLEHERYKFIQRGKCLVWKSGPKAGPGAK